MRTRAVEQQWRELAEAAFTGMGEWREERPAGTFGLVEAAVGQRLGGSRRRLVRAPAPGARPGRAGAGPAWPD